ncbi:MAG: hypothetical protein GX625_07700 [Clostridiaceae bacterium]|nr:hypothetical protein [Clostridiaceae bacterium]
MMINVWSGFMDVKSISYYFDRIRFNVYFDRNHLLSIPEMKDLNRRHVIAVFEAFEAAKKKGFNSRIEVTAPTNETLDIIEKAIRDCVQSVPKFADSKKINDFYAISKVEIARDFILESKYLATLLADRIMSMTGKKYTSRFTIYDKENDPRIKERKEDPEFKKEIFSKRTGYWGNKKSFEFAVYGRYSKINKLPAAHTEWRIIGSANIQRRTGIKSIADMKEFDIEGFFEENDKKFLVYETIDYTALGRWLQGIDGRRNLTKRQEYSAQIWAKHFCSGQRINVPCKDNCRHDECWSEACYINSAAALKKYFEQEKGKIKNVNNKVLGNEKYRFFNQSAITISTLLK